MEPGGGRDLLEKPGGRPGKVLRIPDADLWRVAAGATVLTEPTKGEKVHGLVVRPRPRRSHVGLRG